MSVGLTIFEHEWIKSRIMYQFSVLNFEDEPFHWVLLQVYLHDEGYSKNVLNILTVDESKEKQN